MNSAIARIFACFFYFSFVTSSVVLAQTLGTYSPTALVSGTNISITPSAAPTNTVSMTGYISGANATNFSGTLSVDPVTGVVTVTNAKQAGSFTVTVQATNSDGISSSTTFDLTITDPASSAGDFGPKTDFVTGTRPSSVSVGDFNGDGIQDLSVANFTYSALDIFLGNFTSSTLSILLGNGDGSFSAKTDFVTGLSPSSVSVGDFNGDGKQDLSVANSNSNTVSILLGNGDGSFGAKTDFVTGTSPRSLSVGDFNGDGKQDLSVANESSNNVSILLGNGDGSFGAKTDFVTGIIPFSVSVGDFNGDGKQDLSVANYSSNTVSILLGNGDGSFGAKTDFVTGSFPTSVSVGDFNGDGNQDLSVANERSNTVSILLGNGDGSFGAKTDFVTGSFPRSLSVGDFNGDGNQDLSMANLNSKTVSILLGNGDGSFGPKTDFGTGEGPLSVSVGDFNGDGKQDLSVANFTSNTVSILLGVAPPAAASAPTALSAISGVSSAHISFTEPASNGGLPIINYKYQLDGGTWIRFDPAAKSGAVTIEGLTNCVTYSVKIRAVTAFGDGAASEAVLVTPKDGQREGITWESQTAAAANFWTSVTYGNGRFVAVSLDGTNRVMTSPDGITWGASSVPENNEWTSVTYGNGRFVAVSFDGTNRVMTSENGTTWEARSATENNEWVSVTYGNGLFVAVAGSGTNRVMTSPDGITWTARVASENNAWTSVTYGKGLFVAVSLDGTNRVMTSPDGTTWTASPATEDNRWISVTYGNGLFVAVSVDGTGTNRVMTSPDGLTWTTQNASEANFWASVTYGNGLFVAVSTNGSNNLVMTSLDGAIWTAQTPAETNQWSSVTYGNGLFVAVSIDGNVMTSSALFAPEPPTIDLITPLINSLSVAFSPPASVGGSAISNYEYSIDDGVNWITLDPAQTTSPILIEGLAPSTTYQVRLRAVNDQGVSCESNSVEATTTTPLPADAPTSLSANPGVSSGHISFTEPASNGGLPIINYEYELDGSGTWIPFDPAAKSGAVTIEGLTNCVTYSVKIRAVTAFGPGAASEAVLVTPLVGQQEGITWESQIAAENNQWISVTYGNGQFVAVSASGTNRVMTSPDGITWESQTAASNYSWRSVTYGNGLFVAVSGTGTNRVMTSPDGITWTARVASENNAWTSVTYGNGLFVAVSFDGTEGMTSLDGITWTPTNGYGIPSSGLTSTFGNGLFVSPNTNGVMTSSDGVNWTFRNAIAGSTWNSVTYGNGLYVAVATSGSNRLMTSPDGLTWTIPTVPLIGAWTSVVYGNGLFVAVSLEGTLMTSSDGISWTVLSIPASNQWSSITYGNGTFVAVSFDGKVISSSALFAPGIPTIDEITPGLTSLSVAFSPPADAGGSAISNYEYSIDDGANWVTLDPAQTTSPILIEGLAPSTTYPIKLRAVNDQGVSCESEMVEATTSTPLPADAPTSLTANPGVSSGHISFTEPASNGGSPIINYEYELDGSGTWIPFDPAAKSGAVTIEGLTNCVTYSVKIRAVTAFEDGVASEAVEVTPLDGQQEGITWEYQTATEEKLWQSMTYGNGLFVALCTSCTKQIMTSPDGIAWTARDSPARKSWRSVTYGNGLFVAVDWDGGWDGPNKVMTSPDGITWALRDGVEQNRWTSVTYGNGLFVAVATNGTNQVMTSPDGINWTARTAAKFSNWLSVTYGKGLFVAIASGNNVMTSPDGITWTAQTAAADNQWQSVTYGNGIFVAVSFRGDNPVMTSPDGITWTAQTGTEASDTRSVTYGNGLFVAVSEEGINRVATSPDGITWTSQSFSDENWWQSVAYGNGVFVASSFQGKIIRSSALFAPGIPTIDAITPSISSLSLAFSPPASVGGSAISNYEYSIDDGANWVTLDPAQTTSPILIESLTPSTTYQVKLRAVNDQGVSCESEMVEATTADPIQLEIIVTPGQSKVFGEADPVFTYTVTGFQDGDTEDLITGVLVREPGEDVGVYAINQGSLSVDPKYTINFTSADFEITSVDPIQLEIIVTPGQSKVFGEADPVFTYTVTGFQDGDTEDLITGVLLREPGEDVGVYAVNQGSLSVDPKYTINFTSADFEITSVDPIQLEIIVTPGQSKVFGEADPVFTYTVTGFQDGETEDLITGVLEREPGEDVGVYAINQGSLGVDPKYTINFTSADFEITPATIEGITLEDGSFTFDGTSKSLEITGTLPEGTTVSYTNNERTGVGSQEVTATITGDGFTTVVLTAALTITPATIEDITFEDGTFTFDGTAKSLEITGTLPEGTTVSYTNNERTEVGSQEVTATISGDNYTTLELTATLTITEQPLDVTFEDGSFTFDGASKSLEITGTLPEGTTVTYTNNERTDVGSQEVTATITGDGFTTVVLTATLTITPATIEDITFEDGTFTFDGTAKSLEITGTLPEGTTVSYTNNERTEVGSQEVTATISGDNYTTLELTATLTITEQPLDVTFEDGSFTFDEASKSLEITGTLPEGTSVTYTNNERTDVGSQEVTATITGDGFTTVVLTATLTITPATIEGITFEDGIFTFDGTAKSLEITGTLPEGTTVSYTNNERTEVGSQEVTATISGDNYTTLELTATLTITEQPLDVTFEDGSFTFDGASKSLEITGTLPEGTTVTYTNNVRTDVGSQEVTATITGDGFTTVVLTATLTITPATIEGITFEDGIFTFDGTAKSLEITGTLPEGTTVSYTNNERTEVGSQEVTATITGDNYTTLELTATLTITEQPLDVTFEDGSFTFDGTSKSLEITGTLPEGTTVTYTNNERTDVGSQEVTATITGDGFTTVVLTATLTITPATIEGITFEDGTFTFDGTAKSLEITGTLPEGTTVSYTNNERTEVGSQEVTATISGDNYTTLELTATLTIEAALEEITLEDGTFTFDGTVKSLEITGTLPEGTTVTYTNDERTDVGSQEVTATITGDGFTTVVLTATLTITPATIEGITFEDGTFIFDGTAKSLEITGTLPEGTTVSYTNNERTDVGSQEVTVTITGDGFTTVVLTATLTITPATIEGITFEDGIFTFDGTAKSLEITGTLPEGTTVSYTNNERTEVGSQEVTATISGDNYTTLELTATLAITAEPLDVTFEDGSFIYDGTVKSLGLTGTLPEGVTVSYSNNERRDVGSQEVTATISGDDFVTLELTAQLIITPAELIVIVDEGQSKLLGEPNDPELTFTVTGFGEGDEESVLTGTLVRETGEDIGLYAISQGSLDAGINYTISFTGADFEIVNDDTDGDGVPDAVEIDQGTDPANKDDYRDTDGDDVPDYVEEFVENTDENNPKDYLDRDGDLVPDYVEEVREDTDPTDSADYRDTDGDGVPDYVQDRSIVEFVEESINVAWGTLEGDLVLATEVVGITGRGEFLNLAVIWDLSGYDPLAVGTNSFQGAATLPIRLFDTYPINPVLSITIEPKPAPKDVTLSNSEFVAIPNEFLQEIGFFTVVDPLDDVHEIILITGAADNEYFEIIDGVLFWNSTDQAQGRSQFTIQVSVTDRAGNVLEKSFEITRKRTPLDELDVPNTFTPNNDGVNDTWGIPELGFYGGVKIEIFQIEGGERIFVTEDPEIGWDGSINGKEPVVSAYVWVISIEETGEVLKGMLNLLNR